MSVSLSNIKRQICPIEHWKEENTMRITKGSLASVINLANRKKTYI